MEAVKQKFHFHWDLSLQIRFFVYQYTSLRILKIFYNFIANFIEREDFQFCEIDTESFYRTECYDTGRCMKDDMKEEFYKVYGEMCPWEIGSSHITYFIAQSRKCCSVCFACHHLHLYDKLTPLPFKLEYEGWNYYFVLKDYF